MVYALPPFIDSETNHKRHFIKNSFINKGIEFIDLPSIFKDKSVTSSIPTYFQNSEPPIICYKYRFPFRIDFKKCREEIASALNDFGNRWCKREYVEPNALKEWKVSIFKIVDQSIKFYSQNTNLLPPKPKSTFRHLKYPRLSQKVKRQTMIRN